MRWWWMGLALGGCVDDSTLGPDGCPNVDIDMSACPDGTCVYDQAECEDPCGEQQWCEATEQCVDGPLDCPDDTGR